MNPDDLDYLGPVLTCTRIEVLNRDDAEAFACSWPWGCISITTPEDDAADISEQHRVDLLRLSFANLILPEEGQILFDDEHAWDILDFVTLNWNRMGLLVIHCNDGVHCSSAVAAAISRLKFGHDGDFVEAPFEPNPRIYRILREVATGRGDYQDDLDRELEPPDYEDFSEED